MRVVLFTNARDECKIKEWAAHHLLIGFSQIIIFDHKSKIPLNKVFSNFDKRVKIINVSYLGVKGIKMPLMNRATAIAKFLKADWMIYLDADEFIVLNNSFLGVKHLLSRFTYASSVGINWLMFGSNYLDTEPKGTILESYTRCEETLNKHIKTFTRPYHIINASNPHFYNIYDKTKSFSITGKRMNNGPFNPINDSYNEVPAYIAHYVNQSKETFNRRKLSIPRDDTGEFRILNIDNLHNLNNEVVNEYPKLKYAENVKKFLDK